MNRLLHLLAALGLAAVVLSPAPASAAACTGSNGVTVVVDFGSLGGGVQARCAQTSGTGLNALQAAGFSVTGTQKYGSAFVCRLDGKPSAAEEKCVNTPPGDRSWRYFKSDNTGSWSLSQSGASASKVYPGGFEGWSFGAGTTPRSTPRRAGSSGGSGSGSGGSAGGTAGGSSGGSSTESTPGEVAGPPSSGDKSLPKPKPRSAGPSEPAASEDTATAQPQASDVAAKNVSADDSSSSLTPWIAAGLLLALLALIVVVQRRRGRVRP